MKINQILSYFKYPKSEINIIGSFSDDVLNYYSDIDIQNDVTYINKSYNLLLYFFRRIFNKSLENGIYITDFKAGFYNSYVIRWNIDDLNLGYKQISDNHRVYFVDVFKQKSIIKIDFIVSLNSVYTECSVNYYFFIKKDNFSTQPETIQTLSIAFYQDYNRYKKEGNYYKACKRLFDFFTSVKDKVNKNRIVKFLNSETGHYSFILSHLNNILTLIELNENIPFKTLKASMKKLLDDTEYRNQARRTHTHEDIILLINTINKNFKNKIDEASKKFLQTKIKSHDIILELYKNEY